MNRGPLVLSSLALAACVDVHSFPQRAVTATPSNGGGATVSVADFYTLVFSDMASRFPTSLKIGSTEMLGGGGAIDSTDENYIGISYYPPVRFDGATTPASTPMLTIPLSGPSVAKVKLTWQASACSPQQTFGGTSSFTMFPDGRITRYDHVTSSGSATSQSCGAMAGARWYVTSFTTFNEQAVHMIAPASIPAAKAVGYGADTFQCLTGAHTIGYGWLDNSTRVRAPDNATVALVYDFVTDPNDTLTALDKHITSTMLLDDAESCDALNKRMAPYTTDNVQLAINSNPVGLADDGIYGGAQLDADGGMQLTDPHVTLAAVDKTVPGGFAVWIDFGMAVSSFAVDHAHAVDILPDGRRAIFWFPSDLEVGDSISITPM